MIPSLPAIIPAAGRSSRMGSPKPLLDSGGATFLARILSTLRSGGAHPLLVVVPDLKGAVAAEARREGGEVLLNPDPSPGPVSSLQAGIRALSTESAGVLFSPVDHPLFAPETVTALLRAFHEFEPPLVVPSHHGWRGHPVLFSRQLFPELLEDDLPEGARTVVRRYLEARLQLPVDDPGILANIDTPEEYRKHFP
ncbi:NTP transferase domain-containing protein [Gemmatimonadota bacterium]